MFDNYMIDLETLGTLADSSIVSIGACMFDERGVFTDFYRVISINSCLRAGMGVSASTLQWWLTQDHSAKSVFSREQQAEATPIQEALIEFKNWMVETSESKPVVWGNGADFDNAILAHAYDRFQIPLPWEFWHNRCYRTMKSLTPELKLERMGTYHNAKDDAISQAHHLIQIHNKLGLKL